MVGKGYYTLLALEHLWTQPSHLHTGLKPERLIPIKE